MNIRQYILAAVIPALGHTFWVYLNTGTILLNFALEYGVRWAIFSLLLGLIARPRQLMVRGMMLGAILGLNTALMLQTLGQPLVTFPIAFLVHTILGTLGATGAMLADRAVKESSG